MDLQTGFENIPVTLTRLFKGQNLGKQALKVSDPPLPVKTSAIEWTVMKLMSTIYGYWQG
jgi:hypothetical protein